MPHRAIEKSQMGVVRKPEGDLLRLLWLDFPIKE